MNTQNGNKVSDLIIRAFPFLWFALSIISRAFRTSTTAIYFSAVYYWVLFIFYLATKQFRFCELLINWRGGMKFWRGVILTFLGMIVAYAIGLLPSMLFQLDDGMAAYRINKPISLFLFAVTLIPLPSVVEENFFRKNIISFKSKPAVLATTFIGLFLYAVSHTFNPIGIFSAFMWGVPLAIAYIKTKNIYIPITAHLIANILMNGMDAITIFKGIV